MSVRCRIEAELSGKQDYPTVLYIDDLDLFECMGWVSRKTAEIYTIPTMRLLEEGKAVRLTSRLGFAVFQPLLRDETGETLPKSANTVYNPDGSVFSRVPDACT